MPRSLPPDRERSNRTAAAAIHVFYELSRSIDMKGRPSSVTQGGVVTVELASSDADSALAEWIANSYLEKDGTIRFVDDNQATLKTIEFSKGPGVERMHQVLGAVRQEAGSGDDRPARGDVHPDDLGREDSLCRG